MTCIGGRRPVRILRGDCIIIGYADTASPNGGVSLLLFSPFPSHSLFDLRFARLNKAVTTAKSSWTGAHIAWFRINCVGADSLVTTATLSSDM